MERFALRDSLIRRDLAGTFDGLFLAELLLYGLATILFLFYLNRIFGFAVAFLINAYTWTFYGATVRIQAIQVSPLGGRIFLKGVRYQGQNETILAHDGYITWRYWFRRVRRAEAIDKHGNKVTRTSEEALEPSQSNNSAGRDNKRSPNNLPCRLRIKVRGLEWFVYNRSPAYDTLLATLIDPVSHTPETPESTPTTTDRGTKATEPHINEKEKGFPASDELENSNTVSQDSDTDTPSGKQRGSLQIPVFLQSLPIRITGGHAAMVMGNKHTKSILVAKVRDFDGLIDARAAGPEDSYRQCFDFHLSQGTVSFQPNRDYIGTNVEQGSKFWQGEEPVEPPRRSITGVKALFNKVRRTFVSLQKLNPFFHSSKASLAHNDRHASEDADGSQHRPESSQARWLGLSRYLVDDTAGEVAFERWRAIEYAKVETVADVQSMSLNFFWDVAGPVTSAGNRLSNLRRADEDHVNGSKAPGYGLDMHIGRGRLNYGPWADRQRASLQAVFFPATYAQAKLATRLRPGAWRVSTVFEIRIVLDEDVVLRVDTREESKDWRWKNQLVKTEKSTKIRNKKQQSREKDPEKAASDPEIRPPGWVEVTVAKDSCVTYNMDMFPHTDGYHNYLDLDVKSPKISTSVNHDLFCRAKSLSMKCDLSNPRLWRTLHEWVFGISTQELELFLLRDHAFLIQDLVNDWTAGPSADFFEFVPFLYRINLQLPGTRVYLNVNDSNIINSPSSLEENAFMVIGAGRLDGALAISLRDFQALQSSVSFEADAYQMTLSLSTPPWTTQFTFLEHKQVAEVEHLRFSGSYNYYTSTSSALTDTVLLNLDGSEARVKLFGFLVRYFMNFKENYFGDDLHFQTQEEFQEKVEIADKIRLPTKAAQRNMRQTNDLDVILTVIARDVSVGMPALLYSAEEYVKIDTPLISLDLRFTNYYMDMQADFSPLSISNGTGSRYRKSSSKSGPGTEIFIDGAAIVGHRLFGLPPTEPPYVCNWDFDVGRISGEASIELLSNTVGAAQSFAYGFPDVENAIKRLNALIIRDSLFLRADVQPIKLWIHVEDSAFLLSTEDVTVHFNDWAGDRSSERLSLDVPSIIFACVNAKSAARSRARVERDIETYAFLQTSVRLRLIEAKPDFRSERQLQQQHLLVSDTRTHRVPWMIRDDADRSTLATLEPHKIRPPTMPFPPMPEPARSSSIAASQKDLSGGFLLGSSQTHRDKIHGSQPTPRSGERAARTSFARHVRYDSSDSGHLRHGRLFYEEPLLSELHQPSPSMRLSNPYARPYFPLIGVDPTPDGLPEIPLNSSEKSENKANLGEQQLPDPDGRKKTLVLIVSVAKGIRGMFTPEAVLHLTSLAYGLQAAKADGILDDIQTSTMSSVLSRGRPEPSSITEVRCELPGAAIRLQNGESSTTGSPVGVSWYDLFIRRLDLSVRHTSADPGQDGIQLALHASLQKLDFNILSLDDGGVRQNVFKLELDRITTWAATSRGISANLHMDNIAIASLNRDTKLLANVINQAIRFGQSAATLNEEKQRLALHRRVALVQVLATFPKTLAEAPFMTTTSFTLRTVKFNPRNSDSWKLASRLRWVLHSLNLEERSVLIEKLESKGSSPLLEAKDKTLTAFHQWRGWDLTEPEMSIFVNNVFGSQLSPTAVANETMSKPIHISGSIGQFFVAVDPGPKQDSFAFRLLTCVASNIAEAQNELNEPNIEDTLTIGLFCKSSDLTIKWEMVELIAGLSKQVEPPATEEVEEHVIPAKEPLEQKFQRNIHVVVALEQLSTRIETINLDLATRCFGVTGSLLLSLDPSTALMESLALYSSHVISELSRQQASVMAYKLQQPSVHVSRTVEKSKEERTIITAGGFCESLELHVTQDLLSILGVLDRVLTDEVHFFQGVAQGIRPQNSSAPMVKRSEHSVEIHAALNLDSYSLSAKVLSTLQYAIRGVSARSSCRSMPGDAQTTVLDFDIGAFTHTFTNYDDDNAYQIAAFSLPPINGQVTVEQDEVCTTIAIAVALEEIVLDASALHAMFTTYSRKELTAFRENVARDIKFLKANFENVMGEKMPQDNVSHVSSSSKPLLYRAQISAEGLKIRARTSRTSSYAARLTFQLSHLNFRMHNAESAKKILAHPEMLAEFRSIRIRLKRSSGNRDSRCGDFSIAGSFTGTSKLNEEGSLTRSWEIITTEFDINVYPETASTVVDIIGYLQQRFKSFNFSEEINTLTLRARRLRTKSRTLPALTDSVESQGAIQDTATSLFSSMYLLEMNQINIAWHVGDEAVLAFPSQEIEDLRFSISRVHLSTNKGNAGRLTIQNLQLQMAPRTLLRSARSQTSALMPEVAFNVAYWSTPQDRRLAFQAVGKVIDIRLTSQSVIAAANLQQSIAVATHDLRKVVANWNAAFVKEEQANKNILGNKTLSSVLVAADFAGAVVHISGKIASRGPQSSSPRAMYPQDSSSTDGSSKGMALQAPGITLKLEYRHPDSEDPSLNSEVRIEPSSNTLHPAVVPLLVEISDSVKAVIGERGKRSQATPQTPTKPSESEPFKPADPTTVLGRTRLNLGLRVCKQQFGLTCQPIARVAATAGFDDIYVTISTVQSQEQDRFFALSASILSLQSTLQHVYSREPTGNFLIERVTLSLMNSRHVSDVIGVSAILKVSPMVLNVNAKQMHDFFLFREIWLPANDSPASQPATPGAPKSTPFGVRRYQEVAATGAFPWNALVNIEKMEVQLDLGQSLGKSAFAITGLWLASTKSSDWEQNLCIGFEKIGINSSGRLSGFVELQNFRIQSSIQWPENMQDTDRTPLIEASTTIGQLQAKLAFEYQAFLVADISTLQFLMYNVRDPTHASGDRLVCLVEGDVIQAFCTTQTSAQFVSLFQAIQRLIQEKKTAYETSLKDVEKFLQRKSNSTPEAPSVLSVSKELDVSKDENLIPLQLQTNVVVGLKAVKVGAYPRSFFDNQIFKIEALDASMRFSVVVEDGQVQSGLGLTLGQVRIALSNLTERVERKTFEDMQVAEVVKYSTGSRGGTILKVPELIADMQTWQDTASFHIDYIFKSSFEGRVEVGWNYARISYIRGLWASHSRALAQRLGKPLPQSAVQITSGLEPAPATDGPPGAKEQETITAVVNVPLSKYDYTALEPPLIVTPQLRDMGDATPPLEWIGLHRDRLPNLTHQIVIVPLLEVAKEVEDAYSRILGSS